MSFPTNIFLQNLASILQRTSPVKFAHLAEKSEPARFDTEPVNQAQGALLELEDGLLVRGGESGQLRVGRAERGVVLAEGPRFELTFKDTIE